MATLVASAGGEPAAADQQAADSPRRSARTERMQKEEEVITFLREHFVPTEPILASLRVENKGELAGLLTDLVRDCMLCQSSNVLRDAVSGELLGVCLASKAALFEKQMDRLFRYEFNDIKLRIVIEFLKSVFNRSDVAYHLEENRITKPVFVPLLAVRSDCWNQGMATMMLESCLSAARDDRCDGALGLCSSSRASQLMTNKFNKVICRIRYCDYRGEYREPPIMPPEPDSALHVLLTKL